jgi:hypothetical protein
MQHYKHILLRVELYDSLVVPYINPQEGLNSAADVVVDALKLRKRGQDFKEQMDEKVVFK